jgi:hypothetical protein
MDFEWIKDVICLAKQTWEGWLNLRWFCTTNSSTQTESWMSCLPAEEEHQGCLIGGGGWPGPTGLGGLVPSLAPVSSSTLIYFVTFVPACSTGCTAQTLSCTPLLALVVLPLGVFALSHVHAPLLHMAP